MSAALTARRVREDGFTRVEVTVVALIIAILVAIAIPTFSSSHERAQDRQAQSSARDALTAAKKIFPDTETYIPAMIPGAMSTVEPSLRFPAVSTQPDEVSLIVTQTATAGDTITIGVHAKSDKCFWIKDVTAGGAAGTYYLETRGSDCEAVAATPATVTGASW